MWFSVLNLLLDEAPQSLALPVVKGVLDFRDAELGRRIGLCYQIRDLNYRVGRRLVYIGFEANL